MRRLLIIAITSLTLVSALALGLGLMVGGDTNTTILTSLAGPTHISPSAVASCAFRYSPETVRDRAFAFDGTVESVGMRVDLKLPTEGSRSQGLAWTTFKVNRWFKGGESSEVTIWVDPSSPEGVWPLESGHRLLVAGEYRWGQPPHDPLAWGCGFTQPYTLEAAGQWADAMFATTAMPSTQTSTPAEKPPFVFPEPPLADLTIGEENQTGGLGGSCWSDKSGRPSCRSTIGIQTAQEPLLTDSPFTADFRIRFEESPSELRLEIHPVESDDQLDTRDRDIRRWWRPSGSLGKQLVLPPELETSVDLSLEPGLYVFNVFAKWPELGDPSYGFLVEVR